MHDKKESKSSLALRVIALKEIVCCFYCVFTQRYCDYNLKKLMTHIRYFFISL